MTIRASFDDGASWPVQRLIERGSSAYSSLARLGNDDIGLLYERANYQEIMFARFSWDWVLNN
jgi:sialidase-1